MSNNSKSPLPLNSSSLLETTPIRYLGPTATIRGPAATAPSNNGGALPRIANSVLSALHAEAAKLSSSPLSSLSTQKQPPPPPLLARSSAEQHIIAPGHYLPEVERPADIRGLALSQASAGSLAAANRKVIAIDGRWRGLLALRRLLRANVAWLTPLHGFLSTADDIAPGGKLQHAARDIVLSKVYGPSLRAELWRQSSGRFLHPALLVELSWGLWQMTVGLAALIR